MNNQFSIEKFIEKFQAIPDEQWNAGTLVSYDGQRRCAIGLCGCNVGEQWTDEGVALIDIGRAACPVNHTGRYAIAAINDGEIPHYQQPTPKARVLAFLHDAKAKAEAALDEYERRELKPISKPSTQPVEA